MSVSLIILCPHFSLRFSAFASQIISHDQFHDQVVPLTLCATDEWADRILCLIDRRLLEKSQRIEAILASLQASGAEPEQLTEVEEMITAPEKQQLEALRLHINK